LQEKFKYPLYPGADVCYHNTLIGLSWMLR